MGPSQWVQSYLDCYKNTGKSSGHFIALILHEQNFVFFFNISVFLVRPNEASALIYMGGIALNRRLLVRFALLRGFTMLLQ